MKKLAVSSILFILVTALVPASAISEGGAFVLGRITGTQRELPGYFRNNMNLFMKGVDRVEFRGFRLVRDEDAKSFLIVPGHSGFFYQELPAGHYTLKRLRKDRPGYRESKTIDILRFEVLPDSIVNLGTLNLVLEGRPHESLMLKSNFSKGTYIYRYMYEREAGDSAYDAPLDWFQGKKPDKKEGSSSRIVLVDTAPTDAVDGSRVVLSEYIRWPDK